jgi:hypothetical protein
MSDMPAAAPAASPLGDLFTGNAASLAVKAPSWSRQARPLRGLHRWFSGALLIYLFTELLLGAMAAYQYWGFRDLQSGAEWDDIQYTVFDLVSGLGSAGFGIASLVLFVTCIFLYCRFVYRAMKNLHLSNARGELMEPAWAAADAVNPNMNLWKPHQAMRQIWRSSVDPRAGARNPPATFWGWWLLYLAANTIANISFRMTMESGGFGGDITNLDLYVDSFLFDVGSSIAMVGSILFLRPIIREITDAQDTLSAAAEFDA